MIVSRGCPWSPVMRRRELAGESALTSNCRPEDLSAQVSPVSSQSWCPCTEMWAFLRKEMALCFKGQVKIVLLRETNKVQQTKQRKFKVVPENLTINACIYVFVSLYIYSPCLVCYALCSVDISRLAFVLFPKNLLLFFQSRFCLSGFKHRSLSYWIWTKQNDLLLLLLVFTGKATDICKEFMHLFYKKMLLLLQAKTSFPCGHGGISPGASQRDWSPETACPLVVETLCSFQNVTFFLPWVVSQTEGPSGPTCCLPQLPKTDSRGQVEYNIYMILLSKFFPDLSHSHTKFLVNLDAFWLHELSCLPSNHPTPTSTKTFHSLTKGFTHLVPVLEVPLSTMKPGSEFPISLFPLLI